MLIREDEMPIPRIELRWVELSEDYIVRYRYRCDYQIVLPLDEKDPRHSDEKPTEIIKVSHTFDRGPVGDISRGWISLPYRDRMHATWDTKHLGNLPIYAIYNFHAELLTKERLESNII